MFQLAKEAVRLALASSVVEDAPIIPGAHGMLSGCVHV
jgi:hypothetical protein